MKRLNYFMATLAGFSVAIGSSLVLAAPYASGIVVSGTAVNYITNQDADLLEISINGGAFTSAPDGSSRGSHSFTLGSPTDTFAIRADKSEQGFTQADGGTIAQAGSGLAYPTNSSYGTLISDEGVNTKYFAARGVSVSMNPNAPNFGNAYITSATVGTTASGRPTGDGVYAVKADQTDAYGFGDTAQGTAVLAPTGTAATANTPYRITVANNGEVYVTGFGDAVSGVFRMPANLSTIDVVLAGTTGPGAAGTATCGSCLPVGQNHGSVTSVVVTGSTATNDLTLFTIDEDMTSLQLTRASATDPKGLDNNKIWQYNVGGSTLPYSVMPTAVTATSPLLNGVSIESDLDRGADGKWYLAQNRAQPANSTGLYVVDPSGAVLFDSRLATAKIPAFSTPAGDYNHDGFKTAGDYVIWRKQKGTSGVGLDADGNGDGTVDDLDYTIWRSGNGLPITDGKTEAGFGDIVNDLYSNVRGLAVSPDQKWLATVHTDNTLLVTPLVAGIPDIANRLAIIGGGTTTPGRDIAWDAAGNLHYVSGGLEVYRVIAPGGHTVATTSWNGSSYAFNVSTIPGAGSLGGVAVPEPGTLVLLMSGVFALGFGRRRA